MYHDLVPVSCYPPHFHIRHLDIVSNAALASIETRKPAPTSSDHRNMRSGARKLKPPCVSEIRTNSPLASVDTRQRLATNSHQGSEEADDSDSDVVFMEVRPRPVIPQIKSETNSFHQPPNISFISNMASNTGVHSTMEPNHALIALGKDISEMNKTLGKLQTLGISHGVANLPELVLVGDQSAGKSSLMSALADLSLPRASGTCTRCPTHIQVSEADEWSCTVYIQLDYSFENLGHPITLADVTADNPFPPWKPKSRERIQFKVIQDQGDSEDIELVLRWAQVAILNPSRPLDFFIQQVSRAGKGDGNVPKPQSMFSPESRELLKKLEDDKEAQFSPNSISLEVKGPELVKLSFYDLPGIIMSAQRREEAFLTEVIRNLSRAYIQHPRAIILWAVPMNNDPECSAASSVIMSEDAMDRCVGVMTKADTLAKDNAKSWLAMLKGETHKTGLGYFITYRDILQQGNLKEQNKAEDVFFNNRSETSPPWPQEFEVFKDKCGVDHLKKFLSQKLAEEFAKV
jgi:GTPase SAR1 family protein